MKKQEIIESYKKIIIIENYSKQTVENYLSSLKLFLEFVEMLNTDKITNSNIQDYLYCYKIEKNYSYSSMKQLIASIGYLYKKVLNQPKPTL